MTTDNSTARAVTVENFAEAEVDARIFRFIDEGGMNHGLVYEVPTPTDNQAVPRMNRDTSTRAFRSTPARGIRSPSPNIPMTGTCRCTYSTTST